MGRGESDPDGSKRRWRTEEEGWEENEKRATGDECDERRNNDSLHFTHYLVSSEGRPNIPV